MGRICWVSPHGVQSGIPHGLGVIQVPDVVGGGDGVESDLELGCGGLCLWVSSVEGWQSLHSVSLVLYLVPFVHIPDLHLICYHIGFYFGDGLRHNSKEVLVFLVIFVSYCCIGFFQLIG